MALIAALVAFLALAGRVPGGDAPHLAATTLAISDAVRHAAPIDALVRFVTLTAPQPPVGYLPGIAAGVLVGDRWLAMLLATGFSLWLCWDALRRLGSGGVPWAPGLVLLASPMVWLYVEQYGWDLFVAAAMLQTLSWLHASKGFSDRRATVGFGLWMGAGFLTKYTFPMFLWLPCLWEARHLVRGGEARRNLGRAIGAFALVLLPWLAINHAELAAYLHRSVGADAIAAVEASRAGSNRFTAESLALYPLALKDALGWPGAIVLVVVALATRLRGVTLPGLAAIGGLIVLSCLEQSQDRYALPALAGLAALALPIARLPWGQEVFVGVFAVQLIGTAVTFRPGAPVTAAPRFDHDFSSARAMSWPRSRSYRPTELNHAHWDVDRVVTALAEGAVATRRVGLVLPDDPRLPEPGIYLLRARLLELPLDFAIFRTHEGGDPREGWPGSDVDAVYVMWRPGHDLRARQWVEREGLATSLEISLPGGLGGAVFHR